MSQNDLTFFSETAGKQLNQMYLYKIFAWLFST